MPMMNKKIPKRNLTKYKGNGDDPKVFTKRWILRTRTVVAHINRYILYLQIYIYTATYKSNSKMKN